MSTTQTKMNEVAADPAYANQKTLVVQSPTKSFSSVDRAEGGHFLRPNKHLELLPDIRPDRVALRESDSLLENKSNTRSPAHRFPAEQSQSGRQQDRIARSAAFTTYLMGLVFLAYYLSS